MLLSKVFGWLRRRAPAPLPDALWQETIAELPFLTRLNGGDMSKIVVVGANHAGTAAINTILSNYPDNEVVVFDRNSNISFLGCGMALWIGNQIHRPDLLFYSNKEKLEAAGAKVNMESEVKSIDFSAKKVYAVLKDGSEVSESYDKLILATGSIPILPSIPGRDLENVQ